MSGVNLLRNRALKKGILGNFGDIIILRECSWKAAHRTCQNELFLDSDVCQQGAIKCRTRYTTF
jgi:hypothetical protein